MGNHRNVITVLTVRKLGIQNYRHKPEDRLAAQEELNIRTLET